MNISKLNILNKICYTELAYGPINKKLKIQFSKSEIKKMLSGLIAETDEFNFERIGKNIYVTNHGYPIKITINSNTYRVITVDKIIKK